MPIDNKFLARMQARSGGGNSGGGGLIPAEKLEPFEVVTKGGDTLTWDGDTSGLESGEGVFYKVSDATPTFEDFVNGGIVRIFHTDDGTIEFTQEQIISDGNYLMLPEGVAIVAFEENVDIEGMVLPKKGIYFVNNQSGGILTDYLKINGYTGFTTTEKKLKGEYVIDTNSIILKSSGGKRFRVTVSDTGTLTATEI